MKTRWYVLAAELLTLFFVTLVGVMFWFRPIAEADEPSAALLSPAVNLAIYVLLSVVLFSWVARRMNSPWAAAFGIGAAQYVLVLDLTLRGERGLATAGASAVLILCSWGSVALVHSLLERRGSR